MLGQKRKQIIFWGQQTCCKTDCKNLAKFEWKSQVWCGVHASLKKACTRTILPRDPDAESKRVKHWEDYERNVVEPAAKENRDAKKRGRVACGKMGFRKNPTPSSGGFRMIFPNFKHQNRVDGFGCASLSPMSLGPVAHGQPGLPDCKNLENLHQFNKVAAWEVKKKKGDVLGDPLPVFFKRQKQAYSDPTPHRHKFSDRDLKAMGKTKKDALPLYSVWRHPNGTLKRYTYIQSRYFYCAFYTQLATADPNFKKLQTMLDQGYNLQIFGYDGYTVTRSLMEHYLDPSAPFGHELVLFTLLTESDPKKYPWNVFKEKHPSLYPVIISE